MGVGGKFWHPKWQDDKWVASAEGARKEVEVSGKKQVKVFIEAVENSPLLIEF